VTPAVARATDTTFSAAPMFFIAAKDVVGSAQAILYSSKAMEFVGGETLADSDR
jgi:hypothetical protein